MGQITWVKTVNQLLRGVDRLVVVGQRARLEEVSTAFPADMAGTLNALFVSSSDSMPSATSLTGRARPTWVGWVTLPHESSRHNHPARPDALPRLVGPHLDPSARKVAVVLVGPEAHRVPLTNALYRCLPAYGKNRAPEVQALWLDESHRPVSLPSRITDVAEAARQAASWVDTPPSEMHPARFAEVAKELLSARRGVKLTEVVGERLAAAGLGGIYGVGKAAEVPPRMLVATTGPKTGPHVALVGKGVTFDTGGLHLKARGSMEGMKSDMGGAAAVLGAFDVLSKRKLPIRVTAVICLAENAIGPAATKPDDILTLHSEKTVEINNTDAEGRLLLADGVSWAARKLGADTVIDAATLTGAQLVSTGLLHASVVASDEAVERALVEAGRATGDLAHPLLFAPELFQQEFKSPVADMRNSVKNRMNAQASCAGQFIFSHLEGTGVRWGHVDLAGPAFRGERGTGFGVALLAEAVERLAETRSAPRSKSAKAKAAKTKTRSKKRPSKSRS